MIRRVVGTSMLPTLTPGELIVGSARRKPRVGSLVIINYKGKEIIKRLADIKDNRFYIVGDNTDHSTDSRTYGWLDRNKLIATVIWPRNK